MTNRPDVVNTWVQTTLLPHPYVTVKMLVGINTSTGDVQALVEARSSSDDELIAMYAWPASDVRGADITLLEAISYLRETIAEHRGTFPR